MKPATVVRLLPTGSLVAVVWLMAWVESGSIEAGDWLPYAMLAALLLLGVLASGRSVAPGRLPVAALGALLGLASWQAISLTWSAVPSLARNEALLTALYAMSLALPMLTLNGALDRMAATALVAAGTSTLAIATAFRLALDPSSRDLFDSGRLAFPVSYPNAQAALFLVGFWPSVMLAARRRTQPVLRALALAGAVALLAGWLLTQSKSGGIGLAVSATVFLAVSPARVRVLVPVLIAAGVAATGVRPLTAPFRAEDGAALQAAARHGGVTLLGLAAAGLGIGLLYALVDSRLRVSARSRQLGGLAALAALLAAVVAGLASFTLAVDHPLRFLEEKRRSLGHQPVHDTASSNLAQLGSNRYDFWRVALAEVEHHPLEGIGAGSFGPAYLERRHSDETPTRPHSLELETLSEEGLIGFAFLAAALGLLLIGAGRDARRRRVPAAAALAAGSAWLVHASVDWIWTLPAAGVPFFLLLGIAAAGDDGRALPARAAAGGAALVVALTLLAFAPPWLAARFTTQALRGSGSVASDLRWARRLDPLSPDPLVAESVLATTPAAKISALQRALGRQPRSADLSYLLGLAYLDAGRPEKARRVLLLASKLDPRDDLIARALGRTLGGP